MRRNILTLILLSIQLASLSQISYQFRSRQNGDWTDSDTWEEEVSGSWSNTANVPNNSNVNVLIRNNNVILDASSQNINHLTIENGGKIYTNNTTMRFIHLFGNLRCDGEFGNGSTVNADGAAISVAGSNDTIYGSGTLNPRRIIKNDNTNDTTNLLIAMNCIITHNGGSFNNRTGIYNDQTGSWFNVKIDSGQNVRVLGSISMNQLRGQTTSSTTQSGSYIINGNLRVDFDVFISTRANTTTTINRDIVYTVNSGGSLIVGNRLEGKGSQPGSAKSVLKIKSGGTLHLNGPIANSDSCIVKIGTNDSLIFEQGSTVIYGKNGGQTIIQTQQFYQNYSNVIISGSGTKTLQDDIIVLKNLIIDDSCDLDASNTDRNIEIQGNWINRSSGTNDGFNPRNGKVSFNGSQNAQTFIDSSNNGGNFYNFELENPDGLVILHGNMNIENIIVLEDGKIQTSDSSLLVIKNGGLVFTDFDNTSNFVNGPMRWEHTSTNEIIFPTGRGNQWGRLGITPRNDDSRTGVIRTYQVEYIDTGFGAYTIDQSQSPAMNHVSYVEYWKVSEITNASGNDLESKIKCFYTNHSETSSFATDRDSLVIAHWISNSSHWVREGTQANHTYSVNSATGGWVQSDWVTSFSPFTLGSLSANNPLPANVINLTSDCIERIIRWSSAMEYNVKHYAVEFLRDGLLEEVIVPAEGFSNSIINYEVHFYDNFEMVNLNSEDFDGKIQHHGTLGSCLDDDNPKIKIRYSSNDFVYLINFDPSFIIDPLGRISPIEVIDNTVDLSNYKSGLYILSDMKGNQKKIILH